MALTTAVSGTQLHRQISNSKVSPGSNPFTLLPDANLTGQRKVFRGTSGKGLNFSHERKSAGTHVHSADNNSLKIF